MREIKFRAIISHRNATIYFTLQDLITNKFSNREILWPWLLAGNQPDEFTGQHDKIEAGLYEHDICKTKNGNRVVRYLAPQYYLCKNMTDEIDVDTFSSPTIDEEKIGNIHANPELMVSK